MIGRRVAAAAGIATKPGNDRFRATGITAYLRNRGTLEKVAAMANHASTRTTQLYDRPQAGVSLDGSVLNSIQIAADRRNLARVVVQARAQCGFAGMWKNPKPSIR
jgi:hypothetical protein